jgi:hypothetical protein
MVLPSRCQALKPVVPGSTTLTSAFSPSKTPNEASPPPHVLCHDVPDAKAHFVSPRLTIATQSKSPIAHSTSSMGFSARNVLVCLLLNTICGLGHCRSTGETIHNPHVGDNAADLILRPRGGSQPVGLILVQDSSFPIAGYESWATTLQDWATDVADVALWVAVPQFSNDQVTVAAMSTAIPQVLNELLQIYGLPARAQLVMAAHGASGAAMINFSATSTILPNITALALLGYAPPASTTIPAALANTPILTVSGTLDGIFNVVALAAFSHAQQTQTTLAAHSSPLHAANNSFLRVVLAVPGMSHCQWSMQPPAAALQADLAPELSKQAATNQSAFRVAIFLAAVLGRDTALSTLQELTNETAALVAPIIQALLAEGFYGFAPPCYQPHGGASCQPGCPWLSQHAQAIMGGTNGTAVQVHNVDLFWPVNEVFPHDYLPLINNTCPAFQQPCTLDTRTITELYYTPASVSAVEMMCKLNSRQRVLQHAGLPTPDFNATDGGPRCAEINAAAYSWALTHASPDALARFARIGRPLVMIDDDNIIVYPLWSSRRLSFTPAGRAVHVQSPTMRYPTKAPVVGGLHFCKLLSPARAIEWIYVDGIRPV